MSIEYVKIKKFGETNKKRKNGTKRAVPILVKKTGFKGKVISETPISVKSSILILGQHNSGKSKNLNRFYDSALEIWGGHARAKTKLWLSNVDAIGSWYEKPEIIQHYEQKNKVCWKSLKSWERKHYLPEFCEKMNSVLFIDDAHMLTRTKLDLAIKCIHSSRRFVMTATSDKRLPPTLRQIVAKGDVFTINLQTDTPYDATDILIWLFMASLVAMGNHELAIFVGGLKLFTSGRRGMRME